MEKALKKRNIGKRLNYGYRLIILLMVITAIVAIASLSALENNLNSFVNKINRADTAIKVIRIDTNIAGRNIREMALAKDSSGYEAYKATVEEKLTAVDVELKALKETGVVDEALYTEYVNDITDWASTGYAIIADIEAGNKTQAIDKIFNECVPKLDALVHLSTELDEITDQMMVESVQLTTITFWVGAISILVVFVIALFISMLLGKKTVKTIVEPLHEMENAAHELLNGNLHCEITYRGKDEIGSVAASLDEAFHIISGYVDDVAGAMNEFAEGNFNVQPNADWRGDFIAIRDSIVTFQKSMAETVCGIQAVADQVSGGAEQVSDSSMDLAQGATEQASVTQELAATIETAAEELRASANMAKSVSAKVHASEAAIAKSNEKMHEMVEAMGEISEASEKIHQIIDTINDIAAQTNLLALNASIEAARAGEAGKGFAVVADQVSILAAQSSEAAKESGALIESSLAAVEKGIVIADETAAQLLSVVEDTKAITNDVNMAATGLGAQADSFKHIIAGVDHINDVVQTNSATSQECAAASEEMNSQAEVLSELIRKFNIAQL